MKFVLLLANILTLFWKFNLIYIKCFENNDCSRFKICKNVSEIDKIVDREKYEKIIIKDD